MIHLLHATELECLQTTVSRIDMIKFVDGTKLVFFLLDLFRYKTDKYIYFVHVLIFEVNTVICNDHGFKLRFRYLSQMHHHSWTILENKDKSHLDRKLVKFKNGKLIKYIYLPN